MFYVYVLRVKGFASRAFAVKRERIRMFYFPVAFDEGQWVLHRFLDGLEEAVVGAQAGRFIRHEITRSVEADLL